MTTNPKLIIAEITGWPLWQKIAAGTVLVLVLCWLGWFFFWPKPVLTTKTYVKAMPAHQIAGVVKVAGPVITAPIRIIPKAVVLKKLPQLPIADQDEVIDTAEVPKAPYGATTVTTIDPAGLASTFIKGNERPFFEFKKELEIGGGVDLNTRGEKIGVLDVRFVPLRIGPAHLAIKGEGNFNPQADRKLELKVGVRLFGRFD